MDRDRIELAILMMMFFILTLMVGMWCGNAFTRRDIQKALLQQGSVQYHSMTGEKVLVDDTFRAVWEEVK